MSTWISMKEKYVELKNKKVDEFVQHPDGGWSERGCDIRNSSIGNGVIVLGNCTIENSLLHLNALIKDSVIRNTHVGGSQLVGVVAESSEIFFSNCEETTVKNSKIRDVEVTNSYISKSGVSKGTVRNGIVRLCKLEDCIVKGMTVEFQESIGEKVIFQSKEEDNDQEVGEATE